MRIGIYGGTFNPPHLGHYEATREAIKTLNLEQLILIPTATPPHKDIPLDTVSPQHRLEMTRLMADAMGLPNCVSVSTIELDRGGTSYTVDTLKKLHTLYPEGEFWLLMGTDMFLTFHQWQSPEEILALANICTFGRTQGDDMGIFAPQKSMLERTMGATISVIELPNLIQISSTLLRKELAEGKGIDDVLHTVYGYILRHHLYGVADDLTQLDDEKLRMASYSMVKSKRIPHIRGTEEESVRLARHWGVDEILARRAAILHDCTKYWTLEEHLTACGQYGIPLDEWERKIDKLLHAKSGAGIAKCVFGEGDAVCSAILWHTTGKGDMTMLEKVLYLADYIEPNRVFDGVEEMRKLAYIDLDGAILMGIQMTIHDMETRNRYIHQRTREAEAFFLKKPTTKG